MTTLKFADTHNLVAFLSKLAKSEGFKQIMDFLNANPIRYAPTINPTIYISCIEQFWATVKVKTINGEVQLQALVDGNKIIITESTVRRDLQLEDAEGVDYNVADEAVNEEIDDSLERAATTATSLDAEHDRVNINKTQSKATPNEAGSQGTSLDRLKLEELMALCTTLQSRVLALETTKITQDTEIESLKKRFKKLERRNKSRIYGLKRLYRVGSSRRVESPKDEGLGEENASKQGRIADIDANEDISLVNVQTDKDISMVEEVTAVTIPVSAAITTTTTTAITDVEMTLAQALAELKSAKPKATTITTTPTLTTTIAATTITTVSTRPRSKGIVFHDQEQAPTPTLQAKEEEVETLAREKAQQMKEVNISWDDVQAKIDADYQLAQRLQAKSKMN
ncbi:hypothetical protein Tco_0691287 [Tanacetum coccineum]